MKSILTVIVAVVALALCGGCATKRPGLSLSEAKPVGSLEDKVYQDDRIRVEFNEVDYNLNLVLTNKTGNPVRILWNDASFVDEFGVSHRVMHASQGLSEPNQTQQATAIAPGAKLRDGLSPIDYAKWSRRGAKQEREMLSKRSLGKKVGLLLPVEFTDGKRDYFFQFFVVKSR